MSSTASTRGVRPTLTPAPVSASQPASGLLGRLGGVEILRWPAEEERRVQLALRGEPCILLLGIDEPVPGTSLLEDWVREPVDGDDLAARCEAVRRRALCGTPPLLDDGLLLYHGAWAAIPPSQVGLVELLLARLGRVVSRSELAAAAEREGGSGHDEAVKAAMTRLARRVAPLGLGIRSIRGRGYLLELPDRCPVHDAVSAPKTKGSST